MSQQRSIFRVIPEYQPLVREIGLDGDSIFYDSRIHCWRDIPERQNCTLDVMLSGQRPLRLHIKRFKQPDNPAAEAEADAIRLLVSHDLPTVPLVGWGRAADGRGFLITLDLQGYADTEKAVAAGLSVDRIVQPLALLAARLHRAGLHHRDLYLCHFFVNDANPQDMRLIDAARVRHLPRWPLRQRWIIKDLAQLVFSLRIAGADEGQIRAFMNHYAQARNSKITQRMMNRINRKAARIARHDASLRQLQPTRNVSLPTPRPLSDEN